MTPEEKARQSIDLQLAACGWLVQDRAAMNLAAGRGVAVREFPLAGGIEADYMLFVDRKAAGVIEAKPAGTTLSGVADQSGLYLTSLPENIPHVQLPLPFAYESTGVETVFRSQRDPQPRSRRVFTFHRPETLAEWAGEPVPLRARLQNFPPLITTGLWKAQIEAVESLERSLAEDRPRALIQMATGSGKTFTAVSSLYRLIKFGRVRRVLFLVDRNNLGRQTLKEFQQFITPDDGRKFTELYNVQRLSANAFDPVNRVVITTIQRLYSMLKGEPEFDPANEEGSLFETDPKLDLYKEPLPVVYNAGIPIETFDVIVTDECHRSIYHLWRQVLEYFDASIIGLTATPNKQTLGFFNQNIVMEYNRQRAVADGVNVDGQVYRIRTQISQVGSRVEAGFWVDKRDKRTRRVEVEQLDDDLVYAPSELDREVVSESQIRTVIRAFKEKLFTEIFPGRTEVPKTLIFAKDDSHAEDIVRIVREEFGKGNEFCQKITYRVTGVDPEDLIACFRNAYFPRIAVTVDMIATGTDIKPLEILLFMRLIKSAGFFEQMLGRGTRVILPTDLQAVTPDAVLKDRFVLVDTVGVVEQPKVDTQALERKRSVTFPRLLEQVALGIHDEDTLSSLAGRLARLERSLTPAEHRQVGALLAGWGAARPADPQPLLPAPASLSDLANRLLDAIDPETIEALTPPETDYAHTAEVLADEAALPVVALPELRSLLVNAQQRSIQVIDTVSLDRITEAGFSDADAERCRQMVASFESYIAQHKDEIDALQLIYSRPYAERRLTYAQVRALAADLEQPPHTWTTEGLWNAYARLEKDRVRGAGEKRVLTDLVSLVRHAARLDEELEPYPERVRERYHEWLAAQEAAGKIFTLDQLWWLDRIAETIGVNLSVGLEDLDGGEFFERGGRIGAMRAFGRELTYILTDLNSNL